jgi:hypothetical protein
MKDDEQQRQYQQVSSSSHRKQQICPLFYLLALGIFFLNQGHKGMNTTKYQLKPIKDAIGTNSGAFGKTGAGNSELESSAFLIFFSFLRMLCPA